MFLLLSCIKFPLLYFTFTNEEQVNETLGSLPLNPIKVESQVPSFFRKQKQKQNLGSLSALSAASPYAPRSAFYAQILIGKNPFFPLQSFLMVNAEGLLQSK